MTLTTTNIKVIIMIIQESNKRQSVIDVLNKIPVSAFFTVKFIKRTTGELRTMNCRRDVKKHLKGGELKYSPNTKGLVTVWECKSLDYDKKDAGYRMINLDGVTEIKADGNTYIFG